MTKLSGLSAPVAYYWLLLVAIMLMLLMLKNQNVNKEIPKELNWISKNKDRLNLTGIELDCNMPHNTLMAYLKGSRTLAEKWHPKLINWVRGFIKLNTNNIKKTNND